MGKSEKFIEENESTGLKREQVEIMRKRPKVQIAFALKITLLFSQVPFNHAT